MIDRKNLGVISGFNHWPRFSVPEPVEEDWNDLVARLSPEVRAKEVGRGYHNAGWNYLEVEVRAASLGRAIEEAERLHGEVMFAFQLKEVTK